MVALCLVLFDAGCGARRQSPSEHAASAGDDDLVCRKESVVGSHMRQTVCRRKSGDRAERDATQQSLRRSPGGAMPSEGP